VEELSRPITFVVRAVRHPDGGVTGTVERVLTGQKARFRCANSLAEIIAGMVASADDEPAAEPREEERP
jgi:hypothetical protein